VEIAARRKRHLAGSVQLRRFIARLEERSGGGTVIAAAVATCATCIQIDIKQIIKSKSLN
jgi:hypothetical protein